MKLAKCNSTWQPFEWSSPACVTASERAACAALAKNAQTGAFKIGRTLYQVHSLAPLRVTVNRAGDGDQRICEVAEYPCQH
jgi:hypothetical protein